MAATVTGTWRLWVCSLWGVRPGPEETVGGDEIDVGGLGFN